MLQSGHSPSIPRIIVAGSPNALKDAWEEKQNGLIFYDQVCTFLPHSKELLEGKKLLGIEDGFFYEENKCSDCGEKLTTGEIMSKIMHIGKNDGSLNCQEGKAYCEKCKKKSYSNGTFVGSW